MGHDGGSPSGRLKPGSMRTPPASGRRKDATDAYGCPMNRVTPPTRRANSLRGARHQPAGLPAAAHLGHRGLPALEDAGAVPCPVPPGYHLRPARQRMSRSPARWPSPRPRARLPLPAPGPAIATTPVSRRQQAGIRMALPFSGWLSAHALVMRARPARRLGHGRPPRRIPGRHGPAPARLVRLPGSSRASAACQPNQPMPTRLGLGPGRKPITILRIGRRADFLTTASRAGGYSRVGQEQEQSQKVKLSLDAMRPDRRIGAAEI
jgi:hypothetical protein